jgi:hypothetical protein
MENVYKEAAILAVIWALDVMLRASRVHYWAVPIVFLATLTRADAIVPVAFLLTAFVVIWTARERNYGAVQFVAMSLAPWLVYTAWRAWYFGQVVPNTGIAQHIFVGARLAFAARHPRAAAFDDIRWLLNVGGSLLAAQFIWVPALLVWLWRSPAARHRCVIIVAGGLGCVAQYALFGPARMDPARTVPELALYATLAGPWMALSTAPFRVRHVCIVVGIVAASAIYANRRHPDRAEVGWGTDFRERTVARVRGLAQEYDIPRPLLADPDLGAVSWTKEFNIVDIGMLGSSVLPRVSNPWRYIIEVAKPDVIEIHDGWSCMGQELFTSATFQAEYFPVIANRTPWLIANCGSAPAARSGYWVRRSVTKGSDSPERRFIDAFRQRFDTTVVASEVARCLNAPGRRPCDYVGRTLFRFVPELRQRGQFEPTVNLLQGDRLATERALLTSSVDPHWWRVMVSLLAPLEAS